MEIQEPVGGPENVARVSQGALDFCLTSVSHFLRAGQAGPLEARFVAIIVQRSPMSGIVKSDSDLLRPEDLAGRWLGGFPDSRLVVEYEAALGARGLAGSTVVAMDYADVPAALGRGAIEVAPDFVDLLPRTRRQASVSLRAIPVGAEIYASGLVAADRLPFDLVERFRSAILEALELQRTDPRWALGALRDRYPDVDPEEAVQGWLLAAPNIFYGGQTGQMEPSRWRATVDHLSTVHGFEAPALDTVYRDEFLGVPGQAVQSSSSAP